MSDTSHQPCPYTHCGSSDGELSYVPETGKLYRREKEVGTYHKATGYFYLTFEGKLRLSHRIAFYLMTNRWPEQIDHINGDRSDNRWSNLREVNTRQQATNKKGWSNTGCKGVYWNQRRERYHARVRFQDKVHHVGYFKDLKDAKLAYDKLAKELHGEYFNGGHHSSTLSV